MRIVLADGTTLDIPSDTWTLYRNVDVRKQTREVVQPLARPGIETVTLRAEKAESVTVEKEDLEAYAEIEGDEEALLETEQEMYAEIVSVAFRADNKWRLSVGDFPFWASIEDADFLDRVQRGVEVFRKGDLLRARIEIVQTRDTEGLHTAHNVIEVLDHLPRAVQLKIGEELPPEQPAPALPPGEEPPSDNGGAEPA